MSKCLPIVPGDGHPAHGTPSGYQNHGCRGECCREVGLASNRAHQAAGRRRAGRPTWAEYVARSREANPVRHGESVGAYRRCTDGPDGGRCDRCKAFEAGRRRPAAKRRKRRAR